MDTRPLKQLLHDLKTCIIPNEKVELMSEIMISVLEGLTKTFSNQLDFHNRGVFLTPDHEGGQHAIRPNLVQYVKSNEHGCEIGQYDWPREYSFYDLDQMKVHKEKVSAAQSKFKVKQFYRWLKSVNMVLITDDLAVSYLEIAKVTTRTHTIELKDGSTWVLSNAHWRRFRKKKKEVFNS